MALQREFLFLDLCTDRKDRDTIVVCLKGRQSDGEFRISADVQYHVFKDAFRLNRLKLDEIHNLINVSLLEVCLFVVKVRFLSVRNGANLSDIPLNLYEILDIRLE